MFEIKGRDTHSLARAIVVMNTYCMHCKRPITNEIAYALDDPYFGMLHKNCAIHYSYPNDWPHDRVAKAYEPDTEMKNLSL